MSTRKYLDVLADGTEILKAARIDNYRHDAFAVFEKVFHMDRARYLADCMETCTDGEDEYLALIRRRAAHEPLQYITGVQSFMGFDFKVNENTLIPRLDTEILVEKILDALTGEPQEILDMCTGSGCIGISISLLAREVKVTCADISEAALVTARENADYNEARKIRFVKSDLFKNLDSNEKYDVIVSNPPYIRSSEIEELSPEVRDFEPGLALDGDEDGLRFYREICAAAPAYLKEHGRIFFEIGFDQGEDVKKIMSDAGFHETLIFKDLAGKDRVAAGIL